MLKKGIILIPHLQINNCKGFSSLHRIYENEKRSSYHNLVKMLLDLPLHWERGQESTQAMGFRVHGVIKCDIWWNYNTCWVTCQPTKNTSKKYINVTQYNAQITIVWINERHEIRISFKYLRENVAFPYTYSISLLWALWFQRD